MRMLEGGLLVHSEHNLNDSERFVAQFLAKMGNVELCTREKLEQNGTMESTFKDFEEIIQRGLQNNMPRDANLIILGQIIYAVTRNELSIEEGWQLEKMLGGREQWEQAIEYAILGDIQESVSTGSPV